MSVETVAEGEDWIPAAAQTAAKGRIDQWQDTKKRIEDPDIQEWISQVLGYFKGCYIPESGSRNVADLIIDPKRDPMANPDDHAGIRHIRDYYPSFKPTAAHFGRAYWGKRPERGA